MALILDRQRSDEESQERASEQSRESDGERESRHGKKRGDDTPIAGRPHTLPLISATTTARSVQISHTNGSEASQPLISELAYESPIRCPMIAPAYRLPVMAAHRTIANACAMAWAGLSVASATFWRLISYGDRSQRNDRAACIGQGFCILRYQISYADRCHKPGLYNAIVIALCALANHNAIIMMLCAPVNHNSSVMTLCALVNNNGSVIMQHARNVVCAYEHMRV